MRKFLFIFFLLCPSLLWAYGYERVSCSCGSSFLSEAVDVNLTLDNSGGMNIFYFSTDKEQSTLNIYNNVTGKVVMLEGDTDSDGNLVVDVSANYSGAFDVSFVSCSPVKSVGLFKMISFAVGALCGIAFGVGSAIRW